MSDAKATILNRIRAAVDGSEAEEPIERRYNTSGISDLSLFEDRLIDYGVRVYRCGHSEIRGAIETALATANKGRVLIPSGFAGDLLPNTTVFERDEELSYEQLDQAEGVLTGCALAIAETGTILLRHTAEEGRRALTLIPDYHLCIVKSDQVVATVPEAIRAATQFAGVPMTTISGPSATSDIEMIRVKGVHGPRTLEVILVG